MATKSRTRTASPAHGRWQLATVLEPLVNRLRCREDDGAAMLVSAVIEYVLGNPYDCRDPEGPLAIEDWEAWFASLPKSALWIGRGLFEKTGRGYVLRWDCHPELVRPPIPAALRRLVFERDGYKCSFCSSTERLEIDHIFPWSRGGEHEEDNLQTLCKPCNLRKRDNIQPSN